MPTAGTLDDLLRRHQEFLSRLQRSGSRSALTGFGIQHYARSTNAAPRPIVAFQILDTDGERYRAFDTARKTNDVAAWVRHAAGTVCGGWPFGDVGAFVHGHADDDTPLRGEAADRRFAFLPLPTIEHRNELGHKVGSVRRVLIAAPSGCEREIEWLRRRLPAVDLESDGEVHGLLNLLPKQDWVLQQYLTPSQAWSSVTPVILQRHEIEDRGEVERLLRLAITQAGVLAEIADLEFQPFGFRAGVPPVNHFRTPRTLMGTRVHARLHFKQPVAGPLAVGAGRYRGFGLFAREG